MTSNAIATQGTLVQRGNGATPEVFTTIGEVRGFGGLRSGSAKEIDVTTLSSAAKEFRLGLPDNGELNISLNYDPTDAAQLGLEADRDAQTLRNFRIILADVDATTFNFAALVKTFAIEAAEDDVVRASVGLRVSGSFT